MSEAVAKDKRTSGNTSAAEWDMRVQLAAAFRVAHHLGWNDGVINHITARLPDAPDQFLMNPRGFGWNEITASSLVKLPISGPRDAELVAAVGPAGLNFHSAILHAKPDLACVLHVHAKAGIVISAMQEGLKILDQNGCTLLGQVAYHAFEGYASDHDEGLRIVEELGEKRAMIMWNHGLLTVGRSLAEAFGYMRRLIDACELQERVMATGATIREIPAAVLAHMEAQMASPQRNRSVGALEWEMFLREAKRLDPSFAS